MELNSSGNLVLQAWQLFHEAKYAQVVALLEPHLDSQNIDVFSISILAHAQLGHSNNCDELTLLAAQIGARDFWYQNQFSNFIYAQLIARLDALVSVENETYAPLESWIALTQHWTNGTAEGALYFSVKALRFFWSSSIINRNLEFFANHVKIWISTCDWDSAWRSDVLSNIHFSTTAALSKKEADELIAHLDSD